MPLVLSTLLKGPCVFQLLGSLLLSVSAMALNKVRIHTACITSVIHTHNSILHFIFQCPCSIVIMLVNVVLQLQACTYQPNNALHLHALIHAP